MASERTQHDDGDAQAAAHIAADMEAALRMSAEAAQGLAESKAHSDEEQEEDDDGPPPKRVWTAAELLARAEAQRAEDVAHAKEEAQVRPPTLASQASTPESAHTSAIERSFLHSGSLRQLSTCVYILVCV